MRTDYAVNGQEPLRLLEGLEPAHPPLTFSCRLMGVFGPVIEPVSARMPDFGQNMRKRGRVAAEAIRDHGMRDSNRSSQEMTKERLRSRAIPPCLHQDVDNLTILINRSPQVMNGSVDADEHFVDMPTPAHSFFVWPQPSGVFGSELATPQSDRLIADRHASGGKHLFNVPERERESIVEPHGMGDHLAWEPVALIGQDRHSPVST
jgi:hypothetical protein